MARQLRRLGLGHDDRRAIQTIDPEYYRWTQWIFLADLQLLVRRGCRAPRRRPWVARGRSPSSSRSTAPEPARCRPRTAATGTTCPTSSAPASSTASGWPTRREAPVNWCPGLGTVLSNEEVTNEGRSERGNFPVFKRNLRQWMMRITAYADRLADDLDRVDWPEKVRIMQRNWIGRSHGARVTFPLAADVRRCRRRTRHRRLHDPARHALRRDLHGAGPRAPARRRAGARAAAGPRAPRTRGPVARRPRRRP